ncbi:glutamate-cysteine ligase GCS2 [Micromonospora sp. ATCC 39149]|nr:glutamate-cysteine ligase GCS2 [Micromonospora sp. ATCC 39149]
MRGVDDAVRHIARICFKTGPPTRTGVELEWTVHDAADPARPVDRERLRAALGPHSPTTIDDSSPAAPLRHGSTVTVEPGGQIEISTAPRSSVAALIEATNADIAQVTDLLRRAGLLLGRTGIDPWRLPRPTVDTPRYRAMRCVFDRGGPAGRTMMYSTAGLQVCLDAGEPAHVAARWAAVHAVGPPLLAAFATADRHAGRRTGWASARMAAWLAIDPARTRPVWSPQQPDADPVAAWTAYALAAPLLCLRDDTADWTPPPGVTFGDWIAGALPRPPTTDDLEYHLSTLFPVVRPRGYLEIRYLDTQPGAGLAVAASGARPRSSPSRAPWHRRWPPPGRSPTGGTRRLGTASATRRWRGPPPTCSTWRWPRCPGSPCRRTCTTRRPEDYGGAWPPRRGDPGDDHPRTRRGAATRPDRRRVGTDPGQDRRAHRGRRRRRPDAPALADHVPAGLGPRARRQPGGALAGPGRGRARARPAGHRRPVRRVQTAPPRPPVAAPAAARRGPRLPRHRPRQGVRPARPGCRSPTGRWSPTGSPSA